MKQTRREAISTVALAGLFAVPGTGVAQAANTSTSSREVKVQLASGLVPSPVNYTAMLPAGYDTAQGLPLLLALHGGDEIHEHHEERRPGRADVGQGQTQRGRRCGRFGQGAAQSRMRRTRAGLPAATA